MDISVIIPTLNEEKFITRTITLARERLSGLYEVEFILVDSGSQDFTIKVSKDHFDKVHCDSRLAGYKNRALNAGADLAKGENLLFVDADCLVPEAFDQLIIEALEPKSIIGGAFEFQMDRGGLIHKFAQWFNRIRYRITGNYFGDQGLFCRRSVFEQIGGFPDQPIMEAAYLCRLMRKEGKLRLIKVPIISSIRRFENGGVLKVLIKDAWIWLQFLLGMDIRRYAGGYWNENQKGF